MNRYLILFLLTINITQAAQDQKSAVASQQSTTYTKKKTAAALTQYYGNMPVEVGDRFLAAGTTSASTGFSQPTREIIEIVCKDFEFNEDPECFETGSRSYVTFAEKISSFDARFVPGNFVPLTLYTLYPKSIRINFDKHKNQIIVTGKGLVAHDSEIQQLRDKDIDFEIILDMKGKLIKYNYYPSENSAVIAPTPAIGAAAAAAH